MRNSLVVLAALILWVGNADAGRKRIVVLDFEGPKAEKFHEDLVKLIKKNHTVLSVDKWNEKADEMDAGKVTEKNVKKIAKKLKVDGVVTGKVEKRRDEYIIRLKLRAGTSGEIIGNSVQTKAEGPRLDAQAQRDIKDELISAIEELESNRAGGGDDEEEEESDTPKKKKGGDEEEEEEEGSKKGGFVKKSKMNDEEEEEEAPKLTKKQKAEEEKKKKAEEEKARKEEERLAKEEEAKKKKDEEARRKEEARKADEAFASRNKGKKGGDEEEEEEEPKSKKRGKSSDDEEEEEEGSKKRTAARDEDEEGIEESAEVDDGNGRDLSIAGRALDAVVGMSFTARSLKFAYAADLAKPPPGYKQPVPVAGAIVDISFYPLAFGKTKGIMRGLGLTVLYDRVLLINSQKRYSDAQGQQRIADLPTSESRWAVGPVLRYPMGKIVLTGSLTYGKQAFSVAQTLPNNDPTDIPSVNYTMITPAASVKYPVTPKINVGAELAFHAVTNTGQIQATGMAGYGAATVTGFELEGGGDYMITKNIFARVSLRYETIGIKFKGDPTSQTNIRDTDPEQDVTGARDTYMGGTATVGYVY